MHETIINILSIFADEHAGLPAESEALKAIEWLRDFDQAPAPIAVTMNHLKRKSPHQRRVEEFMKKAGQEVPVKVTIPNEDARKLRAVLIFEEAIETCEALGFCLRSTKHYDMLGYGDYHFFPEFDPNLEEIIDGCCDLKVVTTGTLSALGIPDEVFQEEVDEANLRKFTGDAHRREDGKWIKPSDWTAPNHQGILEKLSS